RDRVFVEAAPREHGARGAALVSEATFLFGARDALEAIEQRGDDRDDVDALRLAEVREDLLVHAWVVRAQDELREREPPVLPRVELVHDHHSRRRRADRSERRERAQAAPALLEILVGEPVALERLPRAALAEPDQ